MRPRSAVRPERIRSSSATPDSTAQMTTAERRPPPPRGRPRSPEFERAVEAVAPRAAEDAVAVDLFQRLLQSSGDAALGDGFVERGQSV